MYYTSYLHSLITQLCEDNYPQWWFPTKPVTNLQDSDNVVTVTDVKTLEWLDNCLMMTLKIILFDNFLSVKYLNRPSFLENFSLLIE